MTNEQLERLIYDTMVFMGNNVNTIIAVMFGLAAVVLLWLWSTWPRPFWYTSGDNNADSE